jgi:hypothetical protein
VTDTIYNGVTLEEMTEIMQQLGFRAERRGGSENLIVSSAGGWRFGVYLDRAAGDAKFTNVHLYASHENRNFAAADSNDWNKTKRFAKSHVDGDGYPVVEYDFFVDGVTLNQFRRCFAMWDVLLSVFMDDITRAAGKTFVSV